MLRFQASGCRRTFSRRQFHAAAALRFGDFEQAAIEVEQVPAGHAIVEVGFFGQIAELVFDVVVAHRLAQNVGVAGCREDEAQQHFDGGGFAGAVAAQEAEDFAFFDLEIEVVDGRQLRLCQTPQVLFGQSLDGNRSSHKRDPPSVAQKARRKKAVISLLSNTIFPTASYTGKDKSKKRKEGPTRGRKRRKTAFSMRAASWRRVKQYKQNENKSRAAKIRNIQTHAAKRDPAVLYRLNLVLSNQRARSPVPSLYARYVLAFIRNMKPVLSHAVHFDNRLSAGY